MSPTGNNIVTGAGDETLRFWNVFPGPSDAVTNKESAAKTENLDTDDDFFNFKMVLR